MVDIKISEELRKICSDVVLGCIQARVKVESYNEELWKKINDVYNKIKNNISTNDISKLNNIKKSREVYRRLGKDPTRYRLASEALIRRIVKGKDLYQINNVVDINNLVSLTSNYSISCFDMDKLKPPVVFTIGKKDEPYIGIGRGPLNIENLPVFSDAVGPFGSPTSDSERTMTTLQTEKILMVIISFSGKEGLKENMEYTKELLHKYADAEDVEMYIIE